MTRKSFFLSIFISIGALTVSAQSDTVYALKDVVVTGTRTKTDVRHLPMTVSIVDRATLTANDRDNILPTIAEQVPGLFVTSRGMMGYGVSNGAAGNISLRGLSAGTGRVMVLIDGHPQYQGIYGHAISDSYQTMMAEQVEVLRGPASVLYGSNAMGGVINIVTRGMKEDGSDTEINLGAGSWGTFRGEVSNQTRIGRFTSTVTGTYGRTDNHRPRMGFEQYGGYIKLGYDLSKNWNVYADADITHFNASYPGATDKPIYEADQWITRGMVSAALENHYEKTNGGISVYSNFGRHKLNDGYEEGKSPQSRLFRSRDALTGISVYQSVQLFTGNRITAGFDWQNIYGRAYYTSRETGEVLDTPNKQSGHEHNNEVAGYVDFRQDIASWLTVDAGIRLDYHSVTGTEWIPQGGIVVRPTSTGELKAMVGKGFRNPTMREMYLYPPSNEDLKPERMTSYELSWKQRLPGNALMYGVNLYYIDGDNMIQTVERKNVNTGKIKNYGVEFDASYRVNSHLSLTTNHSFLHMKYHVLGAPEYKSYAGARYNQGKWSITAGLQYLDGLFTEVETEDIKENVCLLNVAVDYRLTRNITLWASGENLLAQRYEINRGYPMPRATFMGGVKIRIK